MHQIQKLELVGFKSFCDRTTISFNPGTTAIVGPNGCGKSNVADAISWVVGEQSAKSLRTDRMEGVIFSGTQARKATGMAEVTLTLRLMDHFNMPEGLDLNPDGFTVSRRLYRSGESEYSLDGRRCRLKDIQALFEGTGLGPNSYALIEQGRVNDIVNSKPSDRRALIEEAARITLFKSRRYSAEMKLEMAQQNLLRVNDIIREVERQLNSLRRQAAKARRYSRLREEMRGLQRLRLGLEQRDLIGRLEECSGRLAEARAAEQSTLETLAAAESRRTGARESLRMREEILEQLREELSSLRMELSNAESRRQAQESQLSGLEVRSKQIASEQSALNGRADIVRREDERVVQTLAALAEEIERERGSVQAEQSRGDGIQEEIRNAGAAIDELRAFMLTGAGRLSDLRNLRTRSEEHLERISVSATKLENERSARGADRDRLTSELRSQRARADETDSRLRELAVSISSMEARKTELAARIEGISSELTSHQEEYSLIQHRFHSLEEIERRRSNYSEGVQKFLSTRLPGEDEVRRQTLADHVETDPAYEAAVEDYLNDQLQYILVDAIGDAVQDVDRLKRIGAGKCTFLTLRSSGTPEGSPATNGIHGEGVVGYLRELLRMRDDVRRAFERALPDFASTVVVSDLPTAFRIAETHPGTSFLTLSGESYSPRGTLSAVGERKSMAGFLALKREKRELETRLAGLSERLLATRAELARLKEEELRTAETLKASESELRKLELDAVSTRHHIESLDVELRKLEQAERESASELLGLMTEKAEHESRIAEAAADIARIEERSRTSEEELKGLNSRLDTLRADSAATARRLAALVSSQAVREERRSSLETDLRRLAGESDDISRRRQEFELEEQATVARIAETASLQEETAARIAEYREAVAAREEEVAAGQQEIAADREALAALELSLQQLHGAREEAMSARSAIEIEKTRIDSDLDHLERNSREEFHAGIAELMADIPEEEWKRGFEEVARACEELRERIENFGAINMRALEEYQELDQRYQFLTSQKTDIEKSIADTQKAIIEINRRSVEQFEDAFRNIRSNFVEVFQELFKGGQCDLRLLDEGDPLESGVDIVAQPPGKRLQNMLLLSGGEKALTAIALLIAIFRYRPSPFCVLDEVDAPLDDANIGRFTQFIAELSRETQFILITHNKRTMEIAETLYGVTMEEPGVSKIVGVDFRRRPAAS